MDAQQANDRLNDVFLLDVREPQEWAAGHIAGSVHIPMGELGVRREELPRDRTIVCVCRTGSRSALVTRALHNAGYEAENLEGGLFGWVGRRLPVVTDDGGPGRVA